MRWSVALLCAGATGCAPERTVEPAAEPDAAIACALDVDCPAFEICDDEACIPGDRNSTFDDAAPMALGVPADGVIHPDGDVDVWTYDAPGPGWVELRTLSGPGVDTSLFLYDPDRNRHASIDGHAVGDADGADSVLHAFLPRGGPWFVEVTGVVEPGTGPQERAYSLSIDPFDRLTREPDGEMPSLLLPIDDGVPRAVGVLLEAPGDVDHVDVELAVPGAVLEVWGLSDAPGTPVRTAITLADGVGGVVMARDGIGPEGWATWFTAAPGVWRLALSDAGGGGGGDHWATVYVRAVEQGDPHPFAAFAYTIYPDEAEPNDGPARAQWLPPELVVADGRPPYRAHLVQGVLGPADEDWFSVGVDADEQVSVRCFDADFGSTVDLRVDLLRDGVVLTPAGQGSDILENWYYVADVPGGRPGEVQVRLRDEGGTTGPSAYWRCRVLVAEFDWL